MKNIICTFLITILTLYSEAQFFSSSSWASLNINNINCTITNQGDAFFSPASGTMGFEVPNGSGKHAVFAQGLWLGGLDAGGNLHTACMTYRQTGVDFWPGPIDNSAVAAPVTMFNQVYKVDKASILYHQQNYNSGNYIMPYDISMWPGTGPAGFNTVLAPYADYNNNQIYDPQNGDYPYIFGDQACYSITNDIYAAHTETGGNPFGVELHTMTYAINNPNDTQIHNSIFTRYQLANKSTIPYDNFYFGIFVDFDLGNAFDDYIGTDVSENMIFVYNGDSDDEGASGYGVNPPALGLKFLNYPISNSLTYNNVNNSPNGNPQTAIDYYNYLQGKWLDGLPVTYGDDGRNMQNPIAHFMYPGITDPAFAGINWTEGLVGNVPSDRSMLASIGPLTLTPGYVLTIDVAHLFVSGGVTALKQAATHVDSMYKNIIALPIVDVDDRKPLSIFPNPTTHIITLSNPVDEVSVISSDGVLLQTLKQNKLQTIDVHHLPAGIYVLRCKAGNVVNHHRFCKN